MPIIQFLAYWFLLFTFQFRKPNFENKVDMKDYTFYSNLIFTYPKWSVYVLFLNARLVRFPLPVFLGQIINYAILCIHIVYNIMTNSTLLHFDLFFMKLWIIVNAVTLICMCIDHEVWRILHKNDINYKF